MRNIKVVVADDESLARDVIVSHLNKLENINIIATCSTGLQVYDILKNSNPNLLFLDIQMPTLTGIELLRAVKNAPPVIITTAYPHYAVDGFELDVIDYLLKPITFERLLKAIDKYEMRTDPNYLRNQETEVEKSTFNEAFIYIKSDKKMFRIMLNEITYIEGLKDYVKIHTLNNHFITYKTMTYFEEKLPSDYFIRVHRSFIVSLRSIISFSASEISLGGVRISIGSTYTKEVCRKLSEIVTGK